MSQQEREILSTSNDWAPFPNGGIEFTPVFLRNRAVCFRGRSPVNNEEVEFGLVYNEAYVKKMDAVAGKEMMKPYFMLRDTDMILVRDPNPYNTNQNFDIDERDFTFRYLMQLDKMYQWGKPYVDGGVYPDGRIIIRSSTQFPLEYRMAEENEDW